MSLPFPNARVNGPAVSVNAAGDAVVTWDVRTPEPCAEPACTHTLLAAWRRHGSDSWTAPVKLAVSSFGISASVALDGHGDATAVFLEYPDDYVQGGSPRIRSVSLHDGELDTPVTLAVDRYVYGPSVVMNEAGDAVAYWGTHSAENRDYHWDAVYRSGPLANWEQPAVVATGAGASVGVGVDQAGNVLALSTLASGNGALIRSVNRSSASKSWSTPTTIAETTPATRLVLAMNARGDAVAEWVTGDYQSLFVQSVYRPAGGHWTMPETLSRRNEDVLYTSLVIDRAGNALAAWTEEPVQFSRSTWTAYRRASSGRWGPEVALDTSGQVPNLAVNPVGNTVAVWAETPWTGAELRASLWPATLGAWTPTQRLGEAGLGAFDVGVDSHGRALAAWSVRSAAGIESIELSELIPNGPVLGKLHIPRKGTRGVPVTFRVTPAPWGSALKGAPVWKFGDGASASGTSVAHVFRRRGSFEVAVTQLDRAGRKSIVSRSLTVRRS
jgi:hypothetical protein